MEGTVSLSAWEQRNLDSIKDELAGSDPGLATLLATFNQLTSDEEMPTIEEIRAGLRGVTRCPDRTRRHPRWGTAGRVYQRLGLQWAVLLVGLLTTISLITVGVVLSRGGGQGACPRSWAVICVDSATAPTSHPAP
jgi:Protein of unknown function (DUF3040)